MRPIALLVPLFVLVAALPTAPAWHNGVQGGGYGVDAFFAVSGRATYSAGVWDVYWVQIDGSAPLRLNLTWANAPTGVDYDLTLWKEGALHDGRLDDDEILAESWTRGFAPRAEQIDIELPAGEYVVTVEPVHAQGQTYTLKPSGGVVGVARGVPGAVGTKTVL